MPIRPENRHFYSTPAFEALRDLLRARSGNRCERCKAPNGERVFFADQYDPAFVKAPWYNEIHHWWVSYRGAILAPSQLTHSILRFGPSEELGRYIDVVCGCAHLDHDPRHQDPERCAFLCARCHLAHDAKDNHARARRYEANATGQLWLTDEIERSAAPEAGGRIKLEARDDRD
jgi:predicted RNA-binding protein YlxR (DUF448 family)